MLCDVKAASKLSPLMVTLTSYIVYFLIFQGIFLSFILLSRCSSCPLFLKDLSSYSIQFFSDFSFICLFINSLPFSYLVKRKITYLVWKNYILILEVQNININESQIEFMHKEKKVKFLLKKNQ